MAEDPLRTSALVPGSLRMRVCACFYCGSPENYSDTCIEWLWGIRSCPQHKDWAERDCRAECHRTGTVPLPWLRNIPRLAPIVEQLKDKSLNVRRTSGELQSGWKLAPANYLEGECIQQIQGKWTLPLRNREEEIVKRVTIHEVLDENPDLDRAVFEDVIDALQHGIFKAEWNAHCIAKSYGNTTELPEDPRIGLVMFQGRLVRAAM